ncbi:hypothetical protein KCU81_g7383, partial [Aureobasidium melanogenum]|uniref:Uncharacterized protein n=1 Tax=Aureobasidium melanogenum (strain CBS 110374) TaxID=1043003 RepID=A0A074VYL8_AURM1
MSDQEAANIKLMRVQISDNLEYLKGNGPFKILTTYEYEEDKYQVIVLDKDSKVIKIDPQQRGYETVTQALQDVLRRTNLQAEGEVDMEQDEKMRSRDPPSDEGGRPHEASFPGVTPGGLFDTKSPGHFGFEINSHGQRPPHTPLPGSMPSGGMFSATSSRGLFGNSTNTQGQHTCGTAGQGLFAFGTNNNVQGQPTPCLLGNMHPQGQPIEGMCGTNMNTQGWSTGPCQIPSTGTPGDYCTNRAAGGLSGHCSSGQGLFGGSGNASGPSGAYNPHLHVPGLSVSHGLFSHPQGCKTTFTVNLNGLTVSVFSTTTASSKTTIRAGSNDQNSNTVNNQFTNVHRFRPGHRGLWSSSSSPATTHAHVAKDSLFEASAPRGGLFVTQPGRTTVATGALFGPSTRDKPPRLFEDIPIFPATPGPATTPRDRKVLRGGLFGAQPDTSTSVPAQEKSSAGLFGQYTAVPGAFTDSPAPEGYKPSLFSGPSPDIEATADPKTPEPEAIGPRIDARGISLFGSGSANTTFNDTRLGKPSESESKPADFYKRAHFAATVEDASSLSETEKSNDSGNKKSKGKAVSKPRSTEPVTTKKRVSPEPTTPASAPAAKKEAASSGGTLMGSRWAEVAKHAGRISTVTEADGKSSGGVPELSRVGAVMRAAAEQSASVPDDPRSMFASKAASSGVSIPESIATQRSPAPASLFGSTPGSTFAPAPAPAPGPTAAGSAQAPSSFAPSPFAPGSVAPRLSAPGAPSSGEPSVSPIVVPVNEPVKESAERSLKEPVKEAAKESAAAEKKKVKTGGLFDSKYAS